jgi:UDP-N-acetylglucosamine acyltransferase
MNYIHPTAIIYPGVVIGDDCWIGPYVTIGFPGESSTEPWAPRPSGRVIVGNGAVIHEYAHIQSGIYGTTTVGDGLILMAYGHVAHDCQLGDNVVVSTAAILGGHSVLEDRVNIGLNATLHQFSHIRKGTIVGAQSFFKGETGEWEKWYGVPARHHGENTVGRERYT